MVFGTTCAILSYQLPLEKTVTKPLHFVLLFVSFIVLCCGLHAVFKYHDTKTPPIPNMTSLHSWLGITTVIIFSAQLTAGAYHFLPGPDDGIPGVTAESKALYKPLHVVGGILCVVLPVVCCATGMQEKTEFVDRFGIWKDGHKLRHNNNKTLSAPFDEFHGSELTHLNFLGLFLLLQMSFVMFAVMRRGAGKQASSGAHLAELSEGFGANRGFRSSQDEIH